MPIAIVSDIHGNLEALEAVLASIKLRGITEIYCLGDVIGYGPSPKECIEIAKGFSNCTLGNHEAIMQYKAYFMATQSAQETIAWADSKLSDEDRTWIRKRKKLVSAGNYTLLHGSPIDPVLEYIMPSWLYRYPGEGSLQEIFANSFTSTSGYIVGHAHVPGVVTWEKNEPVVWPSDGSGRYQKVEDGFEFVPGNMHFIANAGSVGQPRDRDPRACWLEIGETLIFHKVDYKREETAKKIEQAGWSESTTKKLVERLKLGV